MIYNETFGAIPLNDYRCDSCTLYIVLFVVFLVTSTAISGVFIYFYWYSKKILLMPITNINENSQTSQYKKSSTLLF